MIFEKNRISHDILPNGSVRALKETLPSPFFDRHAKVRPFCSTRAKKYGEDQPENAHTKV